MNNNMQFFNMQFLLICFEQRILNEGTEFKGLFWIFQSIYRYTITACVSTITWSGLAVTCPGKNLGAEISDNTLCKEISQCCLALVKIIMWNKVKQNKYCFWDGVNQSFWRFTTDNAAFCCAWVVQKIKSERQTSWKGTKCSERGNDSNQYCFLLNLNIDKKKKLLLKSMSRYHAHVKMAKWTFLNLPQRCNW